jgi:hypothetical protein
MKKYYFIITILILTVFCANSQDSSTNKNQNIDTVFNEGKAYKMLYENQVKSNDGILKTIFYALGGLGTAVLFVFASNWWFNEKKVKDVIKDIDTKLIDIKKEILAEVAEKVRLEIKEDNKELTKSYQKQLEIFTETYNLQIGSLNENMTLQNSNLREIFDGKETLLKELIAVEQKSKDADVSKILRKLYRVEYYMWKSRGVYRNAFKALVNELEHKLKVDTDIRDIRLTVKNMSENLDNVEELLPNDKAEALKLFEGLPEDEEVINLKREVVRKLEKIKLRED